MITKKDVITLVVMTGIGLTLSVIYKTTAWVIMTVSAAVFSIIVFNLVKWVMRSARKKSDNKIQPESEFK